MQTKIPPRASRTQEYLAKIEDDAFYPQRMPSSTRRYTTTQGHQVIEQGISALSFTMNHRQNHSGDFNGCSSWGLPSLRWLRDGLPLPSWKLVECKTNRLEVWQSQNVPDRSIRRPWG